MKKQFKYITCEEMNVVLERNKRKLWWEGAPANSNINMFRTNCYLIENMIRFEFVCLEDGHVVHYVCFKDGREEFPQTSGGEAWSNYRHYKGSEDFPILIDKEDNDKDIWPSASPLIGFNPKYSGTRQEAYCYDLNSAYSYAMTHIWIDTTKGPVRKEIEEGKEIGFRQDIAANGEFIYKLVRKGKCGMVFPLAPVPECNKRYVANWYSKKKNAKTWQEKSKAKGSLNYLIGEWQNKNPYLRLLIVCFCNEFIENLIDENTLFYNTDSIVSRVRRPDIEKNLGTEIGQWKIEHIGEVAYRGNTYQWNKDLPVVRGKAKSWFKKYIEEHGDWDLLKDQYPDSSYNRYRYDSELCQLVEV